MSASLLACALMFGGVFWVGLAPLLLTLSRCVASALRARVAAPFRGLRTTLLVAFLIYVGPLFRTLERYRWRIRRHREVKPVEYNGLRQVPRILWHERAFYLSYWNEQGREKESLLYSVMDFLLPRKYLIAVDQGWSRWDLEICQGPWAKAQIRAATENHGNAKRLLRVRCALRMSRISFTCLCLYSALTIVAAFLSMPQIAVGGFIAGVAHGSAIAYQKFRLGRVLYHVLESLAQKLNFVPVQKASGQAQ